MKGLERAAYGLYQQRVIHGDMDKLYYNGLETMAIKGLDKNGLICYS
jgi:hypothetical protein